MRSDVIFESTFEGNVADNCLNNLWCTHGIAVVSFHEGEEGDSVAQS